MSLVALAVGSQANPNHGRAMMTHIFNFLFWYIYIPNIQKTMLSPTLPATMPHLKQAR